MFSAFMRAGPWLPACIQDFFFGGKSRTGFGTKIFFFRTNFRARPLDTGMPGLVKVGPAGTEENATLNRVEIARIT